jgi:hypothetical protein
VSHDSAPRGRVLTLLRGDALRDARAAPLAPTPSPATPAQNSHGDNTVYGVPVSAVQHCCGRGCKHCRIYWHRLKP